MVKALLHHFYLIITCRHDGRGIPSDVPGIALLTALFLLAHILSAGLDISTLIPLSFLWAVFYAFFPVQIAGMFLMIDTFIVIGDRLTSYAYDAHWFWLMVQLVMVASASYRYLRENPEKSKKKWILT